MKKLIIILLALFALQTTNVLAQYTDIVNFEAILLDATSVTVTGGPDISVTFQTGPEYNDGFPVIVPTTTVDVVSLLDWRLAIAAPDFDNADGGGDIIPINNVGMWIIANGTNQFGAEYAVNTYIEAAPLGLSNAPGDIIVDIGSGNAGDATANNFILNWKMGSKEGGMNPLSMLDQISAGTIGSLGTYNTIITLTLTTL